MTGGQVKRCKGCGEIKPLTAFDACKVNLDGRAGKCSKCRYAQRKANQSAASRANARARSRRHKAALKAANPELFRLKRNEEARRRKARKRLARGGAGKRQFILASAAEKRCASVMLRMAIDADRLSKPWNAPGLSTAEKFRLRYKLDREFNIRRRLMARGRQLKRGRYGKLGDLMRQAIKNNGMCRTLEELCGYTIADLRRHLESLFTPGMTWERFCAGEIHIDHKKPISLFNFEDEAEMREAWALSNLQPLWDVDNWAKSDKYENDGSDGLRADHERSGSAPPHVGDARV